MAFEYDEGRAALEQLVASYEGAAGERNEATTRLQVIDRLFFECLGWSRDDAVLEDPDGSTYADYVLSAPRRALVIEAKREGVYFEVPAGSTALEYSIPSLVRGNSALGAALEQVAGYCQTRGVPLAAAANGHQLVAFLAVRTDGSPPLGGRAVVFPSLDHMLDNYLLLWQWLSKPGVVAQTLQHRLYGLRSQDIPPRLSATMGGYPGIKGRNVFQTDLQIVSELVLEDVTHAREFEATFLAECYCKSGAISQYSLISRAILEARYAALFDSAQPGPTAVPAVHKTGISADLLAETASRRPILIIGDVGVGKTTFLRYLMAVDAAPLFQDAIALYLDFGSQATLTDDRRGFVLEDMDRQLRETYGVDIQDRNFVHAVYHSDLERFGRGIYGDIRTSDPATYRSHEVGFLADLMGNPQEHLRRSLEHISRGRRQQVIIFLDNSDQREYEVQQEVFLMAQEMAEHWPATVFVALRPETFHRSLKQGALSGYHPKAFTISPPRIDDVLNRRLEFALRITSGDLPITSLPAGVQVRLSTLDSVIRAFLQSIRSNDALLELIDNMAAGNVRLALDLVKGFFGSGHVDTEKIARIYSESRHYLVPLHEFLRAVIYGDSEHYDAKRSPIANMFDVAHADSREHFLLPLALAALAAEAGKRGEAEGFMDTARLYERMQGYGFTAEQIDSAVVRAHDHKLIETSGRQVPVLGEPMPSALRVTPVGLYHILRLAHEFPYIDAVVVDTPIFDKSFRSAIANVQSIDDRLERAAVFREYLDAQWDLLALEHPLFDWAAHSKQLEDEIVKIEDKLRV